MKEQYERDGFVIVPTGVSAATMEEAKQARGPEQPEVYRYNKAGNRWFETWKTSQAVRDIVYAEPVLKAIRVVTGAEPRPLQVILFDRGSDQPLHHDAAHFESAPGGRIIGAWVALEDMDEDNGTLCYVRKGDGFPFPGWQAMGFWACKVGEQERQYRAYERYISVRSDHLKRPFVCKAGTAFVWGTDIIHGGWPVVDRTRTRWSMVTHYALPPVDYLYAPMFGTPEAPFKKSGKWFDRDGAVMAL